MADTDSHTQADESSGTSEDGDETGVTSPRECHETVTMETRETVLSKYKHRCQACGRRGPEKGGLATLHVHHIERDPDGMDEHDLENLTLLCRSCHSWFHQQSTPADSPVEITEADQTVLLPKDIEILRYLAEHGPTTTGDIASGLPRDHSMAVFRQRLWVLMGLDNLVESRERQIVDKDVETGEWGLTDQIENSARGHIPDDPHLLLQRMEDEQVRQALARGCDRNDVVDVLEVSRRTTFNKQKRACAYDFPLDAFRRGGQSPHSDRVDPNADATGTEPQDTDAQQRLDTVADQDSEMTADAEPSERGESNSETQVANWSKESIGRTVNENGTNDVSRAQLQQAIDVLQAIESAANN